MLVQVLGVEFGKETVFMEVKYLKVTQFRLSQNVLIDVNNSKVGCHTMVKHQGRNKKFHPAYPTKYKNLKLESKLWH